jgi:hypothetical protein
VIQKGEGRRDVFAGIYCHWPKAPRIICYDNACQLMHYSTSREPAYFKNTSFVIDRLHEKNHYSCSETFGIHSFTKQQTRDFFQFNDSAAETGNGLLKKIRTSCLYMSKPRFVVYVKLFLEVQNRNRIITASDNAAKAQGPSSSSSSTDVDGHDNRTYEYWCDYIRSL